MTQEKDALIDVLPSKAAADVAMAVAGGASEGIRGTVGDVWGGIIGDRVRQWRQRNLVETLERTAIFLEEKGIDLKDAKALSDGAVYQIFENASKCEDESLQEMWAGLLAREMTEPITAAKLQTMSKILSEMSSGDAVLLKLMVNIEKQVKNFNKQQEAKTKEFIKETEASENINELRSEHYKESNKELEVFAGTLRADIEASDMSDTKEAEVFKLNLLRLGVIEAKTGHYASRNRWGLSRLSRLSSSFDDVETRIGRGVQELENNLGKFERWTTQRLKADALPYGSFSNARDMGTHFKLSVLGEALIDAVGQKE